MFKKIFIYSIVLFSGFLSSAQKIDLLNEDLITKALKDIDSGTRTCDFKKSHQYYRLETMFYFFSNGKPSYHFKLDDAQSKMREILADCPYKILKDHYSKLDINIAKNGLSGESTSVIKYDIKHSYEFDVIYTEHVKVKNSFIMLNGELIIDEVHWNILSRLDTTDKYTQN